MDLTIELLDAEAAVRHQRARAELLEDAVDNGASIGFLTPLAPGEADAYWRTVVAAIRAGSRVLGVARDAGGALVGTAQLDLCTRPNGRHRAEAMKVIVHTRARRRGIGRASGRSSSTRTTATTPSGSTPAWATLWRASYPRTRGAPAASSIRALSTTSSCKEERRDSRRVPARERRGRGQRGAQDRRVDRGKHGRPAHPDRLALPLLRGESCAPVRSRPGVRHAPERPRGHGGPLRAR